MKRHVRMKTMKSTDVNNIALAEPDETAQVDSEQSGANSASITHNTPTNGQARRDTAHVVTESVEKPHEFVHVSAAPRRSAQHGRWFIAAGVILIAIIAGVFLFKRQHRAPTITPVTANSEASTTTATLSPEQQASVSVEVAQLRTISTDVVAPGAVAFNGNAVTPVFSQFSGRLVRLDAEVGMTVRKGQVLGTIDTPDIVASEADYQQALTNERTARTALDLATRTRERSERLTAAEAIPQRELQQAQADEARARDDLQRAQSAIEAARGKLQSAGMSEAEINQLASGAHAVNRLMPLVAPISGTITERKAGLGQVVQSGAGDPLLMIADLSSVWVNADLYEDQLAYVHMGAPVKIQTPAYPTETFSARVDRIGATVDPDKHTVAVRCVVANRDARLKPGMFTNIMLSSAARQNALTVPASAVVTEGDERSVFVEAASGRYIKRPVVVGGENEGAVIIRSGLTEGERVVVGGSLLLSAQQQGH